MSFANLWKECVIVIFTITVLLLTLSPLALAALSEPDIYDQWNTIEEFEEVSSLRRMLMENNWVDESVSLEDLDYILVLSQQLSVTFFPKVPPALTLAVISVESGFQKDLLGFSDDSGLMQVIPRFHKERIDRYLYDENVDIFDPRVNIMTGTDYLSELLETFEGDICLALMSYNMGPDAAIRHAKESGASCYAEMVIERMNAIQDILERRM